jgi:hypothetical protein
MPRGMADRIARAGSASDKPSKGLPPHSRPVPPTSCRRPVLDPAQRMNRAVKNQPPDLISDHPSDETHVEHIEAWPVRT